MPPDVIYNPSPFSQRLTQERNAIIHDFDGVHWFTSLTSVYNFYAEMRDNALGPLLSDVMPLEEVERLGREGYEKTGDGITYLAEKAFPEEPSFRDVLHSEFYRVASMAISAQYPGLFDPCPRKIAAFEYLRNHGVRHGLLTQSHLESWAKPHMTTMGILPFYEPGALIDYKGAHYLLKSRSTKPLQIGMSALSARPEEAVFVEDSVKNLEIAKILDRRILTIYVYNQAPLPAFPHYVDIQCSNGRAAMEEIARVHGFHRPLT